VTKIKLLVVERFDPLPSPSPPQTKPKIDLLVRNTLFIIHLFDKQSWIRRRIDTWNYIFGSTGTAAKALSYSRSVGPGGGAGF